MAHLWVCKSDGDMLVFDPEIQGDERAYVRFWNATTQVYDRYRKEVFRPGIERAAPKEQDQAKAAYTDWMKTDGAAKRKAFLPSEETEWRDLMAKLSDLDGPVEAPLNDQGIPWTLIEAHAFHLEMFGRPAAGIRMEAVNRKHRATQCSFCGRMGDNLGNLVCQACGAPVCSCGACGCV